MARPCKLTPDRAKAICDRLRAGLTRTAAARASGITDSTFHLWYRTGAAEPEDSESAFRAFVDDVDQAESEAEQRFTTLHAQNANGYEVIKSETHDVVVMSKRRYKDERGNWVEEEIPIVKTLTKTTRTNERDLRAPMEWLKRRRRDDYGDHVKQEHSGPNGGPIRVSEVVIEMPAENAPD